MPFLHSSQRGDKRTLQHRANTHRVKYSRGNCYPTDSYGRPSLSGDYRHYPIIRTSSYRDHHNYPIVRPSFSHDFPDYPVITPSSSRDYPDYPIVRPSSSSGYGSHANYSLGSYCISGNYLDVSSLTRGSSFEPSRYPPVRGGRLAEERWKKEGFTERRYRGVGYIDRQQKRGPNSRRGSIVRLRKGIGVERRYRREDGILKRRMTQDSVGRRYRKEGIVMKLYRNQDSVDKRQRREDRVDRRYRSQDKVYGHSRREDRVMKRYRIEGIVDERYWRQDGVDDRSRREDYGAVLSDSEHHLVWHEGDMLQSRYRLLFTIGEGAFARVLKAKDTLDSKSPPVAVKIVKNRLEFREAALQEVEVLKKLERQDSLLERHGVVRLLDHFWHGGHACLVFPLLGLSVYDFMADNQHMPYSLAHVRRIGYQLCCAVNFLHSCGVIHTDIKPENVLLIDATCDVVYDAVRRRDVRKLRRVDVCLVDLGSAVFESGYEEHLITTRHYRAPEVVLGLPWARECDVWSVGCVLMELYSGSVLLPGERSRQHLAAMGFVLGPLPTAMVSQSCAGYFDRDGRLICSEEERTAISRKCVPLREVCSDDGDKHGVDREQLLDIVALMLQYEPSKRISMQEALQQPFLLHAG